MGFKKLIQRALLLSIAITPISYAADPHWTYEEHDVWGAVEGNDLAAKIPVIFPYAECGLGQKQSPINIKRPF